MRNYVNGVIIILTTNYIKEFIVRIIIVIVIVISNLIMKLLHITLHTGTDAEVRYAFNNLGHQIETLEFSDGKTTGDERYLIIHSRAQDFWEKYKSYIDTFDGVITSDTCPTSRAFLQNNYSKLLIIWVCNRFDYYMFPESDDAEYYHLLRTIPFKPNVFIIGNTMIENYNSTKKNVDIGNLVIKPIGKNYNPDNLTKVYTNTNEFSNKFYIPPYYNEAVFMNLSEHLTSLGVNNYCGRFSNHAELVQYKAIITIPYAWSTIAYFERLQLGMVQFIPSIKFLIELYNMGNFIFQPPFDVEKPELLKLSEWYADENKNLVVFFDSWGDLVDKLNTTNYEMKTYTILKYAHKLECESLEKWQHILNMHKYLSL